MNKKSLKIVFFDFDDIKNPLLNAGQAKATYEVGTRLSKKGHEVLVISSKYPGFEDRVEGGISYKHIGLSSSFIRLNNLFYLFTLPITVVRLKADVIIECFTPPVSTLFSPVFTKIPVVILPSMFNAKEFSKKYHLPFHWVEKFGMRFYKYMMPYSNIDSGKALGLNPKINCRIIPQGVGKDYFAIKHTEPKHILFLGRFDIAQKGIDLLLESYAFAKDEIDYPLILAGHGPDEGKIREKIKNLGLGNRVKIVGSAYGRKKKKLMSEALFVAFPSRHDEMSLWSLEALAGGLPLLCFDIPENYWLPKTVSWKVKPYDTKTYASAIKVATESPRRLKEMRNNSQEFAKQFTWETVARKFELFFREVIRIEKNLRESVQVIYS